MHEIIEVELPSQPARVQHGGEGPPLVFLHSEANTSAWSDFHDELAENFEVFAPIHPGFGGEETPDWLTDVSDLSFHYKDLLQDLNLDRPLVVGTSIGAWIAADLAIHFSALLCFFLGAVCMFFVCFFVRCLYAFCMLFVSMLCAFRMRVYACCVFLYDFKCFCVFLYVFVCFYMFLCTSVSYILFYFLKFFM